MNNDAINALKQSIIQQQNKGIELSNRANKLRNDAEIADAEARGIRNSIDSFEMALNRLVEAEKRKSEIVPQ